MDIYEYIYHMDHNNQLERKNKVICGWFPILTYAVTS